MECTGKINRYQQVVVGLDFYKSEAYRKWMFPEVGHGFEEGKIPNKSCGFMFEAASERFVLLPLLYVVSSSF